MTLLYHGYIYPHVWEIIHPVKPVDHLHVQVDETRYNYYIFTGTYERKQEPGYKHVYFNITSQTLAIWTLTILHILFANESIRYILRLIYKRNLRIRMFLLCIINIYPNYYSFWALFNYFNDDFYKQLHHQLFFSITELIVTCLVLSLTNKNNSVISWKTYIIIFINSIHILIGGLDQFFAQLIFGEGIKTLSGPILKARDIGLFFPDVLHLGICLWEIYLELKRKDLKVTVLCQKREFILSCMFAFVLFVMGQNL